MTRMVDSERRIQETISNLEKGGFKPVALLLSPFTHGFLLGRIWATGEEKPNGIKEMLGLPVYIATRLRDDVAFEVLVNHMEI